MPSIDANMARSLRGGVWGSIASGLRANLESRQIEDTVNEVGETFSSWDNCMAQSYCKWPVIAVIIIGGIILISVIWCLARCLCCGLSCCCQCFSCLKCCGNCCGCCDAPGDRKHKYLDEPYAAPNQGYKTQAPMFAPPVGVGGPGPSPAAAQNATPPQYAEFDMGGGTNKRDSNALPAMPTWEGASAKKVSLDDVQESVELESMSNSKQQASQSVMSVNTEPTVPLMKDNGRGPNSPASTTGGRSPYRQYPPAGPGGDPYSPGAQPYDSMGDNGYGQTEAGYGAPAAAMAYGAGRRTPHQDRNGYGSQRQRPDYPGRSPTSPDYNNGFDQGGYGSPAPHEQVGYGMGRTPPPRSPTGPGGPMGRGYPPRSGQSPGPGQGGRGYPPRTGPSPGPGGRGYGPPPRNGPSPAPAGYRRSPGPQNDFGYEQPNQYADRAPDRPQYAQEATVPYPSDMPAQPASPISPGPRNNSGFDFQSGFSRPSTRDGYEAGPPRPAQEERPPPSSGSDIAYPGFKAYQPPQQAWSGV